MLLIWTGRTKTKKQQTKINTQRNIYQWMELHLSTGQKIIEKMEKIKMIRIEAVAQNGIPTKYEPFILTDKENECYWDNLKEEITSLETYEDLDECKKQ